MVNARCDEERTQNRCGSSIWTGYYSSNWIHASENFTNDDLLSFHSFTHTHTRTHRDTHSLCSSVCELAVARLCSTLACYVTVSLPLHNLISILADRFSICWSKPIFSRNWSGVVFFIFLAGIFAVVNKCAKWMRLLFKQSMTRH